MDPTAPTHGLPSIAAGTGGAEPPRQHTSACTGAQAGSVPSEVQAGAAAEAGHSLAAPSRLAPFAPQRTALGSSVGSSVACSVALAPGQGEPTAVAVTGLAAPADAPGPLTAPLISPAPATAAGLAQGSTVPAIQGVQPSVQPGPALQPEPAVPPPAIRAAVDDVAGASDGVAADAAAVAPAAVCSVAQFAGAVPAAPHVQAPFSPPTVHAGDQPPVAEPATLSQAKPAAAPALPAAHQSLPPVALASPLAPQPQDPSSSSSASSSQQLPAAAPAPLAGMAALAARTPRLTTRQSSALARARSVAAADPADAATAQPTAAPSSLPLRGRGRGSSAASSSPPASSRGSSASRGGHRGSSDRRQADRKSVV